MYISQLIIYSYVIVIFIINDSNHFVSIFKEYNLIHMESCKIIV